MDRNRKEREMTVKVKIMIRKGKQKERKSIGKRERKKKGEKVITKGKVFGSQSWNFLSLVIFCIFPITIKIESDESLGSQI